MANSTARRAAAKPTLPIWLHTLSGQWCKTIRGRRHYFGTNQDVALKEYLRVREDLEAGRRPPPADGKQLTLVHLVNSFLTDRQHRVKTGELAPCTWKDYFNSCQKLLAFMGKNRVVEMIGPSELLAFRRQLSETRNAVSVGSAVNRVRVLLNFAFQNGLIEKPIRFGEFKKPSKATVRRQRSEKGLRMFEAGELRRLLEAATGHLRTAILLGVNAAFGPTDLERLPATALDLAGGWLDFPRPKTGVGRRVPLWGETVAALREMPSAPGGLVFAGRSADALAYEFRKLLEAAGLHRKGLGLYGLRHTFQTVGDQVGDYLSTRKLMGHSDSSQSDAYRERFPDDRLRAVADHVRGWLFGSQEEADEPATLPLRREGGVA